MAGDRCAPVWGCSRPRASREIQGPEWYVVWCSIENYDHHFGPTLRIYGEGEPVRLTIPWSRIIGIVQTTKPFEFPVGFRAQ